MADASPPDPALPSAFEALPAIAASVRDRAGRAAVFLDYDGTLTPIVERPGDAVLAPDTRRAIERLAALADVAIVSGRGLDDLLARAEVPGIAYAGSHGLEVRGVDGRRTLHGDAEGYAADVAAIVAALDREVRALDGVIIEEKRASVAVHYRLAPRALVPAIRDAVEAIAAALPRMRVLPGHEVLELRPVTAWDKGAVVELLIAALPAPPGPTIFIGDDVTDEDAFRAVSPAVTPGGIGIVVGPPRPTSARFALRDPAEVRAWLEALATRLSA